MISNVYVDGFNLYNRAVKGTGFKWLDLRKLAEVLFPKDTINRICYFTALLTPRSGDPYQPRRQLVYLRALQTLPGFEAHFGRFQAQTKTRPLAKPVPGLPVYVDVLDSQEKGSDVNLATRLLVDGFTGAYEHAIVVTNDADLAAPMRYVRDGLRLPITVVNPDRKANTPKELQNAVTRVKRLWKSHLRRSQLPASVKDGQGVITKPERW